MSIGFGLGFILCIGLGLKLILAHKVRLRLILAYIGLGLGLSSAYKGYRLKSEIGKPKPNPIHKNKPIAYV